MVSEPPLPKTDPALEASLDGALAIAFRAPGAPSDLRAHVLAAVPGIARLIGNIAATNWKKTIVVLSPI
jgi:hypothetical protein